MSDEEFQGGFFCSRCSKTSYECRCRTYRVESTKCSCHAETCACLPWSLWKGDVQIASGVDYGALWQLAQEANRGAMPEPAQSRADVRAEAERQAWRESKAGSPDNSSSANNGERQ